MATTLERFLPVVGDVLNERYVLREELSRGSVGVVLSATQVGLDELVTIKILMPHVLTNEDMVRRFEREVLLAKGLRHPNTIRILDLGRTAEGLPFYVMEHVPGQTLRNVMRREGCLSPAQTQRIGIQVLRSLSEAHARGIVHRDLKPSNLLLCDIPGAREFVKVLDFGVAKAMADPGGDAMTHTGVVIGTPAYMSPEQARGDRSVDGRCDLYTVGLILAECLLGRCALGVTTLYDAIALHGSEASLDIARLLGDSPLVPVIAKATERDPDDRYADASDMGRTLEALGGLSEVPDKSLLPPAGRERQDTPATLPATPTPLEFFPAGSKALLLGSGASAERVRRAAQKAQARQAASRWQRWAPVIVGGFLCVVAVLLFWYRPQMTIVTEPESDVIPFVKQPALATAPAQVSVIPTPTPNLDELIAAVEAAHTNLVTALPPNRRVLFDGTRDAEIRVGERLLGHVPFELEHPVLAGEVEIVASRRGYRSEQTRLDLSAAELSVDLERRERELERAQLPFGQMDIYTPPESD